MIRRMVVAAVLGLCAAPASASVFDQTPVGGTVRIDRLQLNAQKALGGGKHGITLERVELYAQDARILVPLGDGVVQELPRNPERYFIRTDGTASERFFLAVSADGERFRGMLFAADGAHRFSGKVSGNSLAVEHTVRETTADTDFQCGVQHDKFTLPASSTDETSTQIAPKSTAGSLHQAIVAIDTDNELLNLKFSNNTTTATTYLTDLFAGMNVMYERDLGVRLVQGTTFLRTSDIADPYSQTTTGNQLNEVGGYWMNNYGAIDRAFVAFLSGKHPQANEGSGIAWVLTSGSYCARTGTDQGGGQIAGHYSATQIVRSASAAFNVGLVGHEIGHNFGASHTHCTDINTGNFDVTTNTIDQCYVTESGCYSGPTSCPNDGSMMIPAQGSVMSYCHACGVQNQFHPTQQITLGVRVATNIGNGCFTAIGGGGPNDIFADGFE